MTRRPRRNNSPALKTKVALAAIQGADADEIIPTVRPARQSTLELTASSSFCIGDATLYRTHPLKAALPI
jgi:hypothetical protein